VVLSEELSILESCCLRPMMRNSVLEELRVRRFADIQEEIPFPILGPSLADRTKSRAMLQCYVRLSSVALSSVCDVMQLCKTVCPTAKVTTDSL